MRRALSEAARNNLAARRRRDRGQFRRQRKAHILANQVEIALVRKTEIGEAFTDLLDQNFGSRGTSGEANASDAFEPLGIDIVGGIDEPGFAIQALGEFH